MKKYNVLALGANGFLGRAFINAVSVNNKVLAFDRNEMNCYADNKNVTTIVGDFTDNALIDKLVARTDYVIHMISSTYPSDNTSQIFDDIRDNITPSVYLLESMVRHGTKKILFFSSGGTLYGETGNRINTIESILNPCCGYGIQKATIEAYIGLYSRYYEIDYKIVRISNPYGIGQDKKRTQGIIPILINKLLTDEPICIYGDGSNERDYIYINDLTNGLEKAFYYSGQARVFHLGYGKYYTINQIIEKIEKSFGKKFKEITHIPQRKCDVNRSYLDFSVSQNELNWKPTCSIDKGIELLKQQMGV